MKTKKNPKGAGAKKKDFDEKDWKLLDNAILFGTEEYCSRELGVSKSTLTRRIKEKYNVNFEELKAQKEEWKENNIKLKQFSVAMSGNVTMLIWLGKVLCGQREIEKENSQQRSIEISIVKAN